MFINIRKGFVTSSREITLTLTKIVVYPLRKTDKIVIIREYPARARLS